MSSILWHDYETFGTDPALDRPSQFAAIRTDLELEQVGEPVMIYCAAPDDVLPSIDACLITGISPQDTRKNGLIEPTFIDQILSEFMQPKTCGAGYNSIRFDDEVTRHCLYRNFHDPYAREWQNGNSRWDIIDMIRTTYALRPEGIEWPIDDAGIPSFRLEKLTEANGLAHDAAHDALSDVEATINLAKLVRLKQPKLYEYCWSLRDKHSAGRLIDLKSNKPLLHVSSKIPAERGCTTIVMPVCVHPKNQNGIVCIDLSVDPKGWINLSPDEIRARLYSKTSDLPQGAERVPIKTVHLNRSPILCPLAMLDTQSAARLKIDPTRCESHWQTLLAQDDLDKKIVEVLDEPYENDNDVEASLYSGFIGNADRLVCDRILKATDQQLERESFIFEDDRLSELFIRYKARHYSEALTPEERSTWTEYLFDKYFSQDASGKSRFEQYWDDLQRRFDDPINQENISLLDDLKVWAVDFQRRFNRA